MAIDNARSYTREHRRRHELEQALRAMEATTAIARAVGGETDLERVLELIAKRARALVEARGVLILLREGDELAVATVAGGLAGSLDGVRVPVEGSVSGRVMLERRTQTLADTRAELRFALGERLGATTGLLVPLVFRGRPLGVLCRLRRAAARDEVGAHFTREDERLLESFAASAATARRDGADGREREALRRSIEASERERPAVGARAARRDAAGAGRPEGAAGRRAPHPTTSTASTARSATRSSRSTPRSPACDG